MADRAAASGGALEAMVRDPNEGRDVRKEGPYSLRGTTRWCSPLRAALDTGGDVTFNYASTDTTDFVASASVA